jgi:hypothetical protein
VQTHRHEINEVFLLFLLLLLLLLLLFLLLFLLLVVFLLFGFPRMVKVSVPLVAVDVHHPTDLFPGLDKDPSVEHHLTQKPSFARIAGAGDESG